MTHSTTGRSPDFFIVGAPKAGTTTLHKFLGDHPQIFLPARKEPDFFSHAELLAQRLYYQEKPVTDWEAYLALFRDGADATRIGEASVSYLFYPAVAERIHARCPEARILMVLRDPVERAYSHFLMDQRLGLVSDSFEAIVAAADDDAGLWQFRQQYLWLGRYHDQVRRYLDCFGADRVLVLLFDEFTADLDAALSRVCRFLAVDDCLAASQATPQNVYQTARHPAFARLYALRGLRRTIRHLLPDSWANRLKNTVLSRSDKPAMQPDVRSVLCRYYRDDIDRLGRLLGRDLDHWAAPCPEPVARAGAAAT